MDELYCSVDNLSGVSTTERVNPSDRSSKDKKKNGFSEVLKEKMKEKLKKEHEQDLLILHEDENEEEEIQEENKQDEQQHETQEEVSESETENSSDNSPAEHVDFKA